MEKNSWKVPVEKLRNVCNPDALDFTTTEAIKPLTGILGQQRAVRSLHFGLNIGEHGFNIFVTGLPGTGRTTAVKDFLEEIAKDKPVPPDWCYVNNFKDPYRPKALKLPAGKGREFDRDVKNTITEIQKEIPRIFESEDYSTKKEAVIESFQKKREKLSAELNQRAQKAGFILQNAPVGLLIIPVIEGKPLSDQEFATLPEEMRDKILKKREEFESELKIAMKQLRSVEKAAREKLEKMDKEIVQFTVTQLIEDLLEKYAEFPDIISYLNDVQQDIIENIPQFKGQPEVPPGLPLGAPLVSKDQLFKKYDVNVVVDNSDLKGAPVVLEYNPTYTNLFGRIEKEAQFGALLTDFTMIKGGTLHRAIGGYIVLQAEQIFAEPFTWDGLKRTIRGREIAIEEVSERLGFMATKSLRPEPIPLNAKIIIIGHPYIYHLLYNMDHDFKELFKVKADFDSRMERTLENENSYAAFVCTVCYKEGLKHLDRTAAAKVTEYGSRLADDQEKLSTRFAEVADILREANFYASQDGKEYIMGSHVKKAIEEKIYRSNLIQEKIRDMMKEGVIKIDTTGKAVGQINGLSVISLGDFAFGRPSRITVSTGLGREGIVDIEREAKMGGPIHTKGVLILSGYLNGKYGQDKPLSLSARLVFEQSYEGIEGDSASSTELYAILSSLSGLPINQSLAVTGSVNQKGEVQAIGGVNEKIEGYFEICKIKGLTGEQGVIIPESNIRNLMLKEEVVDAVKEGKFHIYSVSAIDEGIELLTGVKAGERKEDGSFEEGTVNYLVDRRLRESALKLKEFYVKEDKKKPQD